MILNDRRPMTRLVSIAGALLILTVGLVFAGQARASVSGANVVDHDGNGYYDAYIREPTLFATGNVGASCNYHYDQNGVMTVNISVRPPTMWPLNGYSSQNVAWRAVFFNYTNSQNNYESHTWYTGTAYANRPTEFGGAGDGYPFSVNSPSYWAGSQTLAPPPGNQWQPAVQVAWQNPTTGVWTYRYLLVHSALIAGVQAGFPAAYPVC